MRTLLLILLLTSNAYAVKFSPVLWGFPEDAVIYRSEAGRYLNLNDYDEITQKSIKKSKQLTLYIPTKEELMTPRELRQYVREQEKEKQAAIAAEKAALKAKEEEADAKIAAALAAEEARLKAEEAERNKPVKVLMTTTLYGLNENVVVFLLEGTPLYLVIKKEKTEKVESLREIGRLIEIPVGNYTKPVVEAKNGLKIYNRPYLAPKGVDIYLHKKTQKYLDISKLSEKAKAKAKNNLELVERKKASPRHKMLCQGFLERYVDGLVVTEDNKELLN